MDFSKPKRYQRRPVYVTAYQAQEAVELKFPGGTRRYAAPGDWIIKHSSGETFIDPDHVFRQNYEATAHAFKCDRCGEVCGASFGYRWEGKDYCVTCWVEIADTFPHDGTWTKTRDHFPFA